MAKPNLTFSGPWRFGVVVSCIWIGFAAARQSEALALLALPLLAWLWLVAAVRLGADPSPLARNRAHTGTTRTLARGCDGSGLRKTDFTTENAEDAVRERQRKS